MLENIKLIIGLGNDDSDKLLLSLIKSASARLKVLLHEEEVPSSLSYIITEVVIARFNRIGSEGVSSHSVEGESMSWSQDDFAPYKADIAGYLANKKESSAERVRFL